MADGKRRFALLRWFGFRDQDDQQAGSEVVRRGTEAQATPDREITDEPSVQRENLVAAAEIDESSLAAELRGRALEAQRQKAADNAEAAESGGGSTADESDNEAAVTDVQAEAADVEQQRIEQRQEMLDAADEATDTETDSPAVRAFSDETIRRDIGEVAAGDREVEDAAVRRVEATDRAASAAEVAAATDIGDDIGGRPGIEEPLAEVAQVPGTGAGEDLGLGGATNLGQSEGGTADYGGAGVLGGLISGTPGKSDPDFDIGFGTADPRLASGGDDFSGSQEWVDVMDSDGRQTITGTEHYDSDRYTTDVITSHADGVTTQDVTRTDKQTGEVLHERSTDDGTSGGDASGDGRSGWGNKYDTLEEAFGSGGDTSGDDTSGGDTSGGDTSSGDDTDDENDLTVSSGDTMPDPTGDSGATGAATEAFRDFTDSQRMTSAPRILGAESLQQPPDGATSATPHERPPRQVDPDVMRGQLDPYIQYADDHVDIPRMAPEDMQFENTLVDPDPDIGIGGLGGLKEPPGGSGFGPEDDEIGEIDFDG